MSVGTFRFLDSQTLIQFRGQSLKRVKNVHLQNIKVGKDTNVTRDFHTLLHFLDIITYTFPKHSIVLMRALQSHQILP